MRQLFVVLVLSLAIFMGFACSTATQQVAAADAQDGSSPSALPRPDVVIPPSPTALIGLFPGKWVSTPQYGSGDMEVRVTKVTDDGKAEGTVKVPTGFRPTGGHVKFYRGKVAVNVDKQVVLTFERYAGPAVVTYSLKLEGDSLNGKSEVYGVASDVTLTRKKE